MIDNSLLPPDPKRSKSFESLNHYGHRERMRLRVLQKGAASLQDYEILEMLLFLIIPRKDTKPLSKELINYFGSLDAVFDADLKTLKEIVSSDSLWPICNFIQQFSRRLVEPDQYVRPCLDKLPNISQYLDKHLVPLQLDMTCHIRVLFLNGQKKLILDEFIEFNSKKNIAIIIRKAIEFYSTAIIIVRYFEMGDLSLELKHDEACFALFLQKEVHPFSIDIHDYIVVYNGHYLSLFKA